MSGREYGCAMVSSRDQNLDRQMDALRAFGLEDGRNFADRASRRDFDRPQWRRLVRRLRRGDVLVVKSIDRLGRNYEEVTEEWRRITKEKGVDIVVLNMPPSTPGRGPRGHRRPHRRPRAPAPLLRRSRRARLHPPAAGGGHRGGEGQGRKIRETGNRETERLRGDEALLPRGEDQQARGGMPAQGLGLDVRQVAEAGR